MSPLCQNIEILIYFRYFCTEVTSEPVRANSPVIDSTTFHGISQIGLSLEDIGLMSNLQILVPFPIQICRTAHLIHIHKEFEIFDQCYFAACHRPAQHSDRPNTTSTFQLLRLLRLLLQCQTTPQILSDVCDRQTTLPGTLRRLRTATVTTIMTTTTITTTMAAMMVMTMTRHGMVLLLRIGISVGVGSRLIYLW